MTRKWGNAVPDDAARKIRKGASYTLFLHADNIHPSPRSISNQKGKATDPRMMTVAITVHCVMTSPSMTATAGFIYRQLVATTVLVWRIRKLYATYAAIEPMSIIEERHARSDAHMRQPLAQQQRDDRCDQSAQADLQRRGHQQIGRLRQACDQMHAARPEDRGAENGEGAEGRTRRRIAVIQQHDAAQPQRHREPFALRHAASHERVEDGRKQRHRSHYHYRRAGADRAHAERDIIPLDSPSSSVPTIAALRTSIALGITALRWIVIANSPMPRKQISDFANRPASAAKTIRAKYGCRDTSIPNEINDGERESHLSPK